jgi:hypothetical protein
MLTGSELQRELAVLIIAGSGLFAVSCWRNPCDDVPDSIRRMASGNVGRRIDILKIQGKDKERNEFCQSLLDRIRQSK